MNLSLDTKQPLGVGQIISTSWKLYTGNLSQFLPISLRAALWMFVPLLIAAAAVWQLSNQGVTTPAELAGVMALAVPAWLVFYLFCAANSLGETAALSRLSYQQLSQSMMAEPSDRMMANGMGQLAEPETTAQVLRFTRSRKFSFLGSAAIRLVIGAIISFIFTLLFLFTVSVMIASAGVPPQPGAQMNVGLFLVGVLLTFIAVVAAICVSVFVSIRLAIAEQSLAIEQDSGAIDSIGRSWKLMKRAVLKTFAVLFLAALIAFPVSLLLSAITQGMTVSLFDIETAVENARPGEFPIVVLAGVYFVNLLVGTVASIIVTPFLKTVLTTVYFDARNRKENALDAVKRKEAVEV